jgi:hypothetical protein
LNDDEAAERSDVKLLSSTNSIEKRKCAPFLHTKKDTYAGVFSHYSKAKMVAIPMTAMMTEAHPLSECKTSFGPYIILLF